MRELSDLVPPDVLSQARCQDRDLVSPDMFFDLVRLPRHIRWRPGTQNEGELAKLNAERREAAKAVCGLCPVREQCLAHYSAEPIGVFGGLDEDERKSLVRRTRKARERERRANDINSGITSA